jgi:hypothetical protein
MSADLRFLDSDGRPLGSRLSLRAWLPPTRQIASALQLDLSEAAAMHVDREDVDLDAATRTQSRLALRQSVVMVVLVGLIAGSLPALLNWIRLARLGTTQGLVRLAESVGGQTALWDRLGLPGNLIHEALLQIAGLEPRLPAWLAAGFGALGGWVNTPLGLLGWWIAYGASVLAVAHLWGAATSLRRFWIITSFAVLPLALWALAPLPWLGGVISLAATVWSFLLYIQAVRKATSLGLAQAILSVLLPGALLIAAITVVMGMLAGTLIGAGL